MLPMDTGRVIANFFLLPCPFFKILGFEDLGVANRFPAKTGSAGLLTLGLWIIDAIKKIGSAKSLGMAQSQILTLF